jgi:hypothetical protein
MSWPTSEPSESYPDAPIDSVDEAEQVEIAGRGEPVEASVGKCCSNCGGGGDGVDDVAERPEADDEQTVHVRLIRVSRSLVE